MVDSTENRAARRSKAARRAKSMAVAGTAAAAMTLGLAAAPTGTLPDAQADVVINWAPTYTAGTLAGILNWFGDTFPGTEISLGAASYNTGPPQRISASVNTGIPLVGTAALNLFLKYLDVNTSSPYGGAASLYNTIANTPTPTCATGSYASNCRYALMLGTSGATYDLVNAYRAQIAGVTTGQTPAGFIPFTAAPGSTTQRPTWTNEAFILLQNPVRPNGGIMSRFPSITTALGLDPTMPAAGKNTSQSGTIVLNNTTIDATWAYDPIADFPEVFNLTALVNSAMAALPLNLVIGGLGDLVVANPNGTASSVVLMATNLASVLQMGPIPILGTLPMTNGAGYYATIVPNDLPITTPMRLPAYAVNTVLKRLDSQYLLGTPFADAVQPALQILVNIAYPDVVTPSEGGTYNRTFLTGGTTTPFGSVQPLTPEEKKAVPGDVWNALVVGVQAQLAKPFWGIIVPNPGDSAAAVPAAAKPAAVKAAAAEVAPVAAVADSAPAAVAPQVSAPVAAPAVPVAAPAVPVEAPSAPVADPAPVVQVAAPVADPAPAVEISAADDAAAPSSASRGGSHRGRGSSSASSSDSAPKAAASSGRHRAAS